jgi:hypothetical protein
MSDKEMTLQEVVDHLNAQEGCEVEWFATEYHTLSFRTREGLGPSSLRIVPKEELGVPKMASELDAWLEENRYHFLYDVPVEPRDVGPITMFLMKKIEALQNEVKELKGDYHV